MFDRYQVGLRSINADVRVTEIRAPTDESVRLLREMEEKARQEVLKAIRLDENEFKGVLHKQYDPMTDEDKYAAAFQLNGGRHTVFCYKERSEEMHVFINRFRDEIAKEIASTILGGLSQSFSKWE